MKNKTIEHTPLIKLYLAKLDGLDGCECDPKMLDHETLDAGPVTSISTTQLQFCTFLCNEKYIFFI